MYQPLDSQTKLVPVFERCYFVKNGVNLGNDLKEERFGGGVINIFNAIPRIEHCLFDSSDFEHNYGGQGANVGLQGGAVWLSCQHTGEGSFTNEEYAIFTTPNGESETIYWRFNDEISTPKV